MRPVAVLHLSHSPRKSYGPKVAAEDVTPIVDRLRPGHVGSLQDLTSELAAAALTDLFLRTGYAQARVSDPDRVRQLVRTDCRRRGCKVRTLGAHGVVVLHDEERHQAFLETCEGAAYAEEMDRRVMAALPSYESRPELRLVTPPDSEKPS